VQELDRSGSKIQTKQTETTHSNRQGNILLCSV